MEMLAGTPVTYGSIVQLLHLQSKRFVGVMSRTLAEVEKHCTAVNLRTKGRPTCYWKITPRYKYRREGEKVVLGDVLVLVACKGGDYLHAGVEAFPHSNTASQTVIKIKEVNASPVCTSVWCPCRCHSRTYMPGMFAGAQQRHFVTLPLLCPPAPPPPLRPS
jgi:hypothetical protein